MLSEDQKARLHKAIDAARNPGLCRYIGTDAEDGSKSHPLCVIGQLAVLEGVSTQDLHAWDRAGCSVGTLFPSNLPSRGALMDYPLPVLKALQGLWDRGSVFGIAPPLNEYHWSDPKNVPALRERMHREVEAWS